MVPKIILKPLVLCGLSWPRFNLILLTFQRRMNELECLLKFLETPVIFTQCHDLYSAQLTWDGVVSDLGVCAPKFGSSYAPLFSICYLIILRGYAQGNNHDP